MRVYTNISSDIHVELELENFHFCSTTCTRNASEIICRDVQHLVPM